MSKTVAEGGTVVTSGRADSTTIEYTGRRSSARSMYYYILGWYACSPTKLKSVY